MEQWGDTLKMNPEKVSNYLGSGYHGGFRNFDISNIIQQNTNTDHHPVPQSDVALAILYMKKKDAKHLQEKLDAELAIHELKCNRNMMNQKIRDIISTARKIDHQSRRAFKFPRNLFAEIFQVRKPKSKSQKSRRAQLEDCFYPVVQMFHERCFDFMCNDYAIYQVKKFWPLCKYGIAALKSLRTAIDAQCQFKNPVCGVY